MRQPNRCGVYLRPHRLNASSHALTNLLVPSFRKYPFGRIREILTPTLWVRKQTLGYIFCFLNRCRPPTLLLRHMYILSVLEVCVRTQHLNDKFLALTRFQSVVGNGNSQPWDPFCDGVFGHFSLVGRSKSNLETWEAKLATSTRIESTHHWVHMSCLNRDPR